MLRIIIRIDDIGAAAHVGGPVQTSYRTVDVALPTVEQILADKVQWDTRTVIGVEVLPVPPGGASNE